MGFVVHVVLEEMGYGYVRSARRHVARTVEMLPIIGAAYV